MSKCSKCGKPVSGNWCWDCGRKPRWYLHVPTICCLISYGLAAFSTLCMTIGFLYTESQSPGLSFAIASWSVPLLLFMAGLLKVRTGMTKEGKIAGAIGVLLTPPPVAYIFLFFPGWQARSIVWVGTCVPVLLCLLLVSSSEPERPLR